jgi:hypothetical protein
MHKICLRKTCSASNVSSMNLLRYGITCTPVEFHISAQFSSIQQSIHNFEASELKRKSNIQGFDRICLANPHFGMKRYNFYSITISILSQYVHMYTRKPCSGITLTFVRPGMSHIKIKKLSHYMTLT